MSKRYEFGTYTPSVIEEFYRGRINTVPDKPFSYKRATKEEDKIYKFITLIILELNYSKSNAPTKIDIFNIDEIKKFMKENNIDESILEKSQFKASIARARRIIENVNDPENTQKILEELENDEGLNSDENLKQTIQNLIINVAMTVLAQECINNDHDISNLGPVSENPLFIDAYNKILKEQIPQAQSHKH